MGSPDRSSDSSSAHENSLPRMLTRREAQKLGAALPFKSLSNERQLKRRAVDENKPTKAKHLKKLDTNIFESYLENLWNNISEEKQAIFMYLDSLWFSLYREGSTKVLRWIQKKKIYSRKYVFVPIVCWGHWNLLILCDFGEISKSETPCMLLLDSLAMADPKRLEPEIRKFVLDIYCSEGQQDMKRVISKIPLVVPKVPQQKNGDECGLCVLYFIHRFIQMPPENRSIVKGDTYFMQEEWFRYKEWESFQEDFLLKNGTS
ncbi:hypothetical protein QJS10_CPA06g01329 [Acorus calamus]|uniref:Ubiquitin-like protease family profile domain-containing protein n=1 Tax=Acorus calamus TaxID=4465 RepID=A0AAV9EP51_ACOCL|nr:hypothetical protein QJS10_CPA06g01329 [Acorus calamus]